MVPYNSVVTVCLFLVWGSDPVALRGHFRWCSKNHTVLGTNSGPPAYRPASARWVLSLAFQCPDGWAECHITYCLLMGDLMSCSVWHCHVNTVQVQEYLEVWIIAMQSKSRTFSKRKFMSSEIKLFGFPVLHFKDSHYCSLLIRVAYL